MRQLLATIVIPEYPLHFEAAGKVRETYYEEGKKIPPNLSHYLFKDFTVTRKGRNQVVRRLVSFNGHLIVKNPEAAGKARVDKINGQKLFTGMTGHEVFKITEYIKKFCKPYIHVPLITELYPLYIRFIYCAGDTDFSDVQNHREFYEKALLDLFQTQFKVYGKRGSKAKVIPNPVGFIPDDHKKIVNKVSSEYIESIHRELIIEVYGKYEENGIPNS